MRFAEQLDRPFFGPLTKSPILDASEVASVAVIFIFSAAILVYACWGRHQRAKFRGEVVQILEQYMPVDRQTGRVGRPQQQQQEQLES